MKIIERYRGANKPDFAPNVSVEIMSAWESIPDYWKVLIPSSFNVIVTDMSIEEFDSRITITSPNTLVISSCSEEHMNNVQTTFLGCVFDYIVRTNQAVSRVIREQGKGLKGHSIACLDMFGQVDIISCTSLVRMFFGSKKGLVFIDPMFQHFLKRVEHQVKNCLPLYR